MKILHSWLKEYGNIDYPPQKIAEILTELGLEVEGITATLPEFSGVMVGRITDITKHPNADKLNLCEVELNPDKKLRIVCGAQNVQTGKLVPVAIDGADLGGVILKCREIRGIHSEGMICSEEELGFCEKSEGIWLLENENLQQGKDFRTQLTEDFIYELSIGPNRPDCLGLRGILRELSLRLEGIKKLEPKTLLTAQEMTCTVKIIAEKACPRYVGALLRDVTVKESPAQLRETITKLGLRPVNNVVDVTNLLTYVYGMPMHAFDADCLQGDQVIIRFASAGETIETIDGVKRTLNTEDLMICDAKRPVALAGVMGGIDSEIKTETKNVFIELAFFEPVGIRKSAKRHKLHTDASHRYERGMDPELPPVLLPVVTAALQEVCGGEIAGWCDVNPLPRSAPLIEIPENLCARILGINFEPALIMDWCRKLQVKIISESPLRVEAPSFRPDLERPIDMIEEFARIYGLNNIDSQAPSVSQISPKRNHHEESAGRLRSFLSGKGMFECINYPFVKDGQDDSVELMNPIARDMTFLRRNLSERLLQTGILNYKRDNCNLGLYEIGNVFCRNEKHEYTQNMHLGVLLCNFCPESWKEKPVSSDIFDLKGLFEGLCQTLRSDGFKLEEVNDDDNNPLLEKQGKLNILFRRQKIGTMGTVKKKLLKEEKISAPMVLLELNLEPLLMAGEKTIRFKPVSAVPGTERRLALLTPEKISAEEVLTQIKRVKNPCVEQVRIFDIYTGDGIPDGHKSIGISIYFRGREKTMSEEEMSLIIQEMLNKLEKIKVGLRP
jgi:phenylalanyl-tRNA synthetase beta chain